MLITGLDWGARHTRFASWQEGRGVVTSHQPEIERSSLTFQLVGEQQQPGHMHYRAVALKRTLDFDSSFPGIFENRNTLELLSEYLQLVRRKMERVVSSSQINCVMAVPSCFSQRQRAACRKAAEGAGLSSLVFLDDSLAALLANRETLKDFENVLVYSWGAAFFTAGLFQVKRNSIQPLAQEGSPHFGGDDLDLLLANSVLDLAVTKGLEKLPEAGDPFEVGLLFEAEKVKRSMLNGDSPAMTMHMLFNDKIRSGFNHETFTLLKKYFEKSQSQTIAQSMHLIDQVLAGADEQKPNIILTSGGMANTALIIELLKKRFRTPVVQANEDAVALGALSYGMRLAKTAWHNSVSRKNGHQAGNGKEEHRQSLPEEVCDSQVCLTEKRQSQYLSDDNKLHHQWADNFMPLLNSAQNHYESNRLQDAIADFEKLTFELNKFSIDLYRKAAAECSRKGTVARARDFLTKAMALAPGNVPVIRELGSVCLQLGVADYTLKKWTESLATVQPAIDAITSLPDSDKESIKTLAELHYVKALALFATQHRNEALGEIRKAINLKPSQEKFRKAHEIMVNSCRQNTEKSKKTINSSPEGKVGRNAQCSCGSGKKFKRCCGR